jgi:hypothetical protein
MKKQLALAAILLVPTLAMADGDPAKFAVGLGAGTTGADLALTYKVTDNVNVRGIVSGINYSKDGNYGTSGNYSGDLKLFQAGILGDYHPFSGGFRVSGGAVYNGTELKLNGKPKSDSTFNVNGNTYTGSEVGNINAESKWDKPALYLGVGYGNPVKSKGFSLSADLGVLFTGSPSTNLNVQCGAAIAGTPTCTQLQSDAAAEQIKLRHDTDKVKYWAVGRIMANYAFF